MAGIFKPFRRISCRCNRCGASWKIPRRRILFAERYYEVSENEFFLWKCDKCLLGTVVPELYVNIHGKKVVIDPNHLPPNAKVVHLA